MTSGFATLHIAVTVLITAALSIPVAAALLRAPKAEAVTAALVAGLTTFGWRLAANVDALNADGVPWVSANDALAPVVTYVTLGMYASLRPPTDTRRFEQLRVALAAVAFVVNVVAI